MNFNAIYPYIQDSSSRNEDIKTTKKGTKRKLSELLPNDPFTESRKKRKQMQNSSRNLRRWNRNNKQIKYEKTLKQCSCKESVLYKINVLEFQKFKGEEKLNLGKNVNIQCHQKGYLYFCPSCEDIVCIDCFDSV